ncbi:MAG: hypothetical protein RIC30_11685 [Marinoscillum sp.]|uniref:hypothetical protein n=1 Tax=Marinoscillum sp. TaxID=2024838 RepID=UPI0032F3FE5D
MDFSYLISISDGDTAFIQEFISTFESNSTSIIEKLKISLQTGNFDSNKKLAHQLKPSLEMLGLSSLQIVIDIQNSPETVTQEQVLQIESECKAAVVEMNNQFNL